ncbi:hypothetical protein ACLB2K_041571 [Fragaria x ananassa]
MGQSLQKRGDEEEKGRGRRRQKQGKSTQIENERGEEGEENKPSKKAEEERKRSGEPARMWSSHFNSFYFFCSISIFLSRPLLRRKPQKHVFNEPPLPSRARPQCRSNFKALRCSEMTLHRSISPKARRDDFA